MNYKELAICLVAAAILVFAGTISCQMLAEKLWEEAINRIDAEVP